MLQDLDELVLKCRDERARIHQRSNCMLQIRGKSGERCFDLGRRHLRRD